MEVKDFKPLVHENVEFKRWMLNFARELSRTNGFQNGLAASLIYSSFVEYLCENLLENLKYLTYQGTYNYFGSLVYFNSHKERRNLTLGAYTDKLDHFDFPDKKEVLSCLSKIVNARNNIVHKFAKADMEAFRKIILEDIFTIQKESEVLVNLIDSIYEKLRKKVNPVIKDPDVQSLIDALSTQIEELKKQLSNEGKAPQKIISDSQSNTII